jgi:Domain of unknown function (DUF1707)
MAGPGDEIAAGKAGRGHLRASHADREQVVGTLKAAFVQGMLAKDEFDLRVSQAFASRTYADLAALTADLPAAKPPQPARAQGEHKVPRPGRWIAVATALYAGVWAFILLPPWPTNSEGDPPQALFMLLVMSTFSYLFALPIAAAVALENLRDRRSGGQPPRGQAPGVGGQASQRLAPADPGGQLPPAGPGHQQTAQAAPGRRPLLPGWRPPATASPLSSTRRNSPMEIICEAVVPLTCPLHSP